MDGSVGPDAGDNGLSPVDASNVNENQQMNNNEGDAGAGADEWMDPSHPLMNRVQIALRKQLLKEDERLTLLLREKSHEVAKLKKQRESAGVNLYALQQRLAMLQLQLEKTHATYEVAQAERIKAEQQLEAENATYQKSLGQKQALDLKRDESQQELDKLQQTLRQVDEFNQKLKDEIKVTRRVAYGTEESMQSIEKEKKHQDLLIDSLNEQLVRAKEQQRMYTAQIASQKEEMSRAQEVLRQASQEMEVIQTEKREYLAKWKSSLLGMQNRDSALQKAEEAVLSQKERLRAIRMEKTAISRLITEQNKKQNQLESTLSRVQAEVSYTDQALLAAEDQNAMLSEKYAALRSNLETNEGLLKAAMEVERKLEGDISHVQKQHLLLVQQKQKIDDEIMNSVSGQTTLEKGAQGLWRLTMKLKEQIHQKEIKLGETQNELSRIRVDALNTQAHNQELQATLKSYDKELKDQDSLIEKYEMEIRQRHDQIDKKQIYVARLNRKYEQIMARKEEENTGELEATIKNLTNEINAKSKENAEKQRLWLQQQTELVELVSNTNDEGALVTQLKYKETILTQKQIRLNQACAAATTEIKRIASATADLRKDVIKLNELIGKNRKLKEELTSSNFVKEADFMNKLKELEKQSIALDETIAAVKREKETVLNETVEMERQILLWENKIELERETQQALDPQYGQAELIGMQKEIHRMQLRLTQLKRQQEKMIQEMERAIGKRENIKLGSLNFKSQKHGVAQPLTGAQLAKKVALLKVSLKESSEEVKHVMHQTAIQEAKYTQLQEQLVTTQQQHSVNEELKINISAQVADELLFQQLQAEQVALLANKHSWYLDALNGRMEVTEDKETLMQELLKSAEKQQLLREVLVRLRDQNPRYESSFKQLLMF